MLLFCVCGDISGLLIKNVPFPFDKRKSYQSTLFCAHSMSYDESEQWKCSDLLKMNLFVRKLEFLNSIKKKHVRLKPRPRTYVFKERDF